MRYIYLLILCIIIALIVAFKNYKIEAFKDFSPKKFPLKFIYGFCMLFIRKPLPKDILMSRLRTISICTMSFTALILMGFIYTFTNKPTDVKNISGNFEIASSHLEIPTTEGSSIADDSTDNESYNYVKETIAVFEKYREDIELSFLGDNQNLFAITEPLNLITEYGEENIHIRWDFETDGIIDNNGNIIYDNVGNEGFSTLAYAHLSLNDISATLTIPICISPP